MSKRLFTPSQRAKGQSRVHEILGDRWSPNIESVVEAYRFDCTVRQNNGSWDATCNDYQRPPTSMRGGRSGRSTVPTAATPTTKPSSVAVTPIVPPSTPLDQAEEIINTFWKQGIPRKEDETLPSATSTLLSFPNDPKYAKYVRMQKVGLTDGAIKNAMLQDGVEAPSASPPPSLKDWLEEKAQSDGQYIKFARMLKMRVPEQAVLNKISAEGLEGPTKTVSDSGDEQTKESPYLATLLKILKSKNLEQKDDKVKIKPQTTPRSAQPGLLDYDPIGARKYNAKLDSVTTGITLGSINAELNACPAVKPTVTVKWLASESDTNLMDLTFETPQWLKTASEDDPNNEAFSVVNIITSVRWLLNYAKQIKKRIEELQGQIVTKGKLRQTNQEILSNVQKELEARQKGTTLAKYPEVKKWIGVMKDRDDLNDLIKTAEGVLKITTLKSDLIAAEEDLRDRFAEWERKFVVLVNCLQQNSSNDKFNAILLQQLTPSRTKRLSRELANTAFPIIMEAVRGANRRIIEASSKALEFKLEWPKELTLPSNPNDELAKTVAKLAVLEGELRKMIGDKVAEEHANKWVETILGHGTRCAEVYAQAYQKSRGTLKQSKNHSPMLGAKIIYGGIFFSKATREELQNLLERSKIIPTIFLKK